MTGRSSAGPSRLLETLGEAALIVQRARDKDAIFGAAADALEREGLYSSVFEVTAPGIVTLRLSRAWDDSIPAASIRAGRISFPLAHMPDVSEAIGTGRPVFEPDAPSKVKNTFLHASAEEVKSRMKEAGARAVLVLPLLVERVARAVLVVMAEQLSSPDVAALSLFGAQISSALETVEVIGNLHQRNRELAALNAIARLHPWTFMS